MGTNTHSAPPPSPSLSPPSSAVGAMTAAGLSTEGSRQRTDQIVKIELEAAEVLAGLAHSSMRKNSESGGGKWGNKGKRARNRSKNESPAADSGKKPKKSSLNSVDLAQDQAVLDEQQREDLCRNVKLKTVKAKQDSELPETNPVRSKNQASIGRSKFKHNLTEAEKEERKIRRILANRESARQTIRRRQAICDELTKKAADLSMENANLKREKELAQKEYESLKNINEYLKEQIAKPIKSKEVEIPSEPLKSTHVEISAPPPTSSPLQLYNPPTFTPFVWPFIIQSPNSVQLQHDPPNGTVVSSKVLMPSTIQSSNSVQSQHGTHSTIQSSNSVQSQHGTQSSTTVSSNVPMPSVAPFSNPVQTQAQNAVVIPPRVPMPVFGNLNHSHEQENHLYVDGPNTPICLLPYHPWFFHIPNQGIGLYHQPSFSAKDKQFETSVNYTNSASLSSQTVSYVESHHSSSPIQVKPEARTAYNLNETPFGFPLDGEAKHVEAHPKGTIFKPTPLTPVISSLTTKRENGPTPGFSIKEATSSTVSHTASSLPRKNRVPAIYPCKTPEDVVAAAEARKRRKELTKLKNLRPFRINC